MTQKEAKQLKNGDLVFFEYQKSIVKSEIRNYGSGNVRIDLKKGYFLYGAHINDIFLPTKHVEEVSIMVSDKRQELLEMNFKGANINPDIFGAFEDFWIKMCKAEGNDAQYQIHKTAFEKFLKQLFKVAGIVNSAKVGRIPYLRR